MQNTLEAMKRLDTSDLQIEDNATDGYLLGALMIGQVPHHVTCLRVRKTRSGEQVIDSREAHVRSMWEDLCSFDNGGAFLTVSIEGHPGEWVLMITPYVD